MSANQLVCVRRPEPSLSAIFEEMYQNERLVDVTLTCSDGQLQAHRLVLAASSPYFSGIFDKLANPFHYPVIVIKDMQFDDLKMIVDFMYKGQLTLSQERLMSLIKSAENLQINGLSNTGGIISTNNVDSREQGPNSNNNIINRNSNISPKFKRSKKSISTPSSTMNLNHHQAVFARNYHQSSRQDDIESRLTSPQPDKLLEQSMVTGESLDSIHQFSYANSNNNNSNNININDPTSTRNLNNQQLHTPSPSSLHVQHLSSIDSQQHHHHQLTNQLQVLSHSLAANRSSLNQTTGNSQQSSLQASQHNHQQQQQQQPRGRVHPCNICWKTFREKANLKRHLQVHSLDRIIYACPDCNKTFSWKDNYIRHTKTAHHINNVKPQA